MKLTLVKKKKEVEGVLSFFWQPDTHLLWKPGQYLYYTLELPTPDPRGNVRHFTIASSPTENFISSTGEKKASVIQLTTKIDGSIFKNTLRDLPEGAQVEATGPRGDFVLDEEIENLQVFLAGGIGITPFRSFIKFALDKGFKTPIHLIYSNPTPEQIVFREELDAWLKESHTLTISYTITKPEESNQAWSGLNGHINADLIKKLLTTYYSLPTITFWVCGPPAFVGGMQDELQKLGISPERIEMEQFTGY